MLQSIINIFTERKCHTNEYKSRTMPKITEIIRTTSAFIRPLNAFVTTKQEMMKQQGETLFSAVGAPVSRCHTDMLFLLHFPYSSFISQGRPENIHHPNKIVSRCFFVPPLVTRTTLLKTFVQLVPFN